MTVLTEMKRPMPSYKQNITMKRLFIMITGMFLSLYGLTADAQDKQMTFTFGSHTYTMKGTLSAEAYDAKATGTVTFTNIPVDYTEFEAVYTQFLGKTPHGAAAMMPMAMELYRRDREIGLQCLKLLCYPSNVNSVTSILNTKYGPAKFAPANDPYLQPYLPAAVLKGATPDNGYTPLRPYTVEMKASVNKHQKMQFMGDGTVMYIYVMGKGWDTEQRQVEVISQPGNPLFQVFNCPSLYTQCKQIKGQWKGLE
jgi:hypothetical protein